jgi:FSR family fosmidomycin resistance protein-like MFS transporter
MKYRSILTLSAAHAVTDINQGAVPALLPFLIGAYGLSYAAAAAIVFATNISSSLVQPFFGHFADRKPKPWLLPAGILFAGVGLALAGVVPSYRLVLCVVALSA